MAVRNVTETVAWKTPRLETPFLGDSQRLESLGNIPFREYAIALPTTSLKHFSWLPGQ